MDSFRFDYIYENGYYYVLQPIDDAQLGGRRGSGITMKHILFRCRITKR